MEKKKRVLLVTQYFYPENFKSNDIAFELQKRGYQVEALVGIPNYPEGKYYKGYGIFQKRIEIINGVRVYRAFQTPRGRKATGLGLSINYLTYAFFASIWALFFAIFKKKYDSIIVHQTSPITQALPSVIISKIRKTPISLWVLDLWPNAFLSGYNARKDGLVINILDNFTNYIYKNSDKILISSKLFSNVISEKGDFKDKIIYFPNWSEDFLIKEKKEISIFPKGFIITLAGTLGVSQDLESVVKLACELIDVEEVKIVLLGDGSKRKWLEREIEIHNLKDKLFYLGKQPFDMMPSYYSISNAMLLTLNANYDDLKMVVPARLQSYMSASRPVLGMIEGGAADIIREAKCGYVVDSGDVIKLAKIIREIVLFDINKFEQLGQNGRKFYEDHFSLNKCIDSLIIILDTNETTS